MGVGLGGPAPFCGLLNISALHVQYGIQAFAKFKRPECTRLHLRNFSLKHFPGGACSRNSFEKCAIRSHDGHNRAHMKRPLVSGLI